jgi:hypothetical protein
MSAAKFLGSTMLCAVLKSSGQMFLKLNGRIGGKSATFP